MSVFVFASTKAAPGVTTAVVAVAATWPAHRRVVVAECDADGGDLAAWYGLASDPGLVSLAAQGRSGLAAGALVEHTQPLPGRGDVRVLVGPASARQATAALTALASAGLGVHLADSSDLDVLVDAGRLRPGAPLAPLLGEATATVLVARPTLAEVRHLRAEVAAVPSGSGPQLLLIGQRPYRPDDVAAAVDRAVIGVLADDGRGAAALAGRGGGFRGVGRSPLARSAVAIGEHLIDLAGSTPADTVDGADARAGGGQAVRP